MSVVQRFWAGLRMPFVTWGELKSIRGRRFILILILINIMLAIGIYRYGMSGWIVQVLVDLLDARLDAGWQWLVSLANVIFNVVAFIMVSVVAVRLGTIIGSPFYGVIAERIDDKYLAGEPVPHVSILLSIRNALWYEWRKVVVVAVVSLVGFVLEFIPAIGVFIGSGFVVVSLTLVTLLDYTDVPMSRRGILFRQRFTLFRQYLPEILGFAIIMVPLSTVPIVNFVAVPLGITAGALLFVKYMKPTMNT
ncbi:MAG: EI24 domain-containing protein [Roseiflexaceae bacterium]